MRVVIAGGHGQIALRLERLLSARGDRATGLIRKPQEAEEAFRAAIQLEPVMVAAHYGLGLALSQAGRRDDAKAAFTQARDLDPKSPFSELAKTALKQLGEGG